MTRSVVRILYADDIERELPTHFDLVLNTETLAPEDAADLIVRAAGLRSPPKSGGGKDGGS